MKELVVGLDNSTESRLALRWAAAVAAAVGVPLRAVEAWTYPTPSVLRAAEPPVEPEEMDRRTAESIAAVVSDELGTVPPFVKVEPLRGLPAGAILQSVGPESVLVLGSRGRGGFAALLLGSVSRECTEHAPCPVVIVRHDRPVGSDAGPIIVGVDGSPTSEGALDWAVDFCSLVGGQVVAVHAWQSTSSESPPRLLQSLRTAAQTLVESWVDGRESVRAVEVQGDPREQLIDVARRMDATMIVLGRIGGSTLRGTRVGGVTSYLARHSPTTLVVVPAPTDDSMDDRAEGRS